MSEIEKLYENANADKDCKLYANYGACPDKTKECTYCEYYVYPEFTAEKQLKLIKWLIIKHSLEINKGRYTTYFMCNRKKYKCSSDDDFTMLIKYMNEIWQDLTEEERKQIKEILE